MDKFQELTKHGTGGDAGHVDTADLIAQLQTWDRSFGIEISEVGADRVTIQFKEVPSDAGPLAKEIYKICPDTIDQGLGCIDEMIESLEMMGEEIPADIAKLVDGVDLSDENYGLVLLAKELKRTKSVLLWWD